MMARPAKRVERCCGGSRAATHISLLYKLLCYATGSVKTHKRTLIAHSQEPESGVQKPPKSESMGEKMTEYAESMPVRATVIVYLGKCPALIVMNHDGGGRMVDG